LNSSWTDDGTKKAYIDRLAKIEQEEEEGKNRGIGKEGEGREGREKGTERTAGKGLRKYGEEQGVVGK
jgi:hypothetical protein